MTRGAPGWLRTLDGDVRANPAYRLLTMEAMPEQYVASLDSLGVNGTTAFGLLVADAATGLPDKVVDRSAAELFSALHQPGPVPSTGPGVLAALVLDGVLEMESVDGFVSGPMAYEAILARDDVPPPVACDRLSGLSFAALAYAERLRLLDVNSLTARLYCYYRVPLSRRWARAYPDARAVLELVPQRLLARNWLGPSVDEGGDWIAWARRDEGRESRSADFPYKLYVSPDIEAVPGVLTPLIEALIEAGVARFKIGADAAGLLRPDKIVVYLRDANELTAVAGAVGATLEGVVPHGVPFSAELGGDGLLSWGGDPPSGTEPVGAGRESWRLSVCRRLAEYLLAAQTAPLRRTRPAGFALARLALDGVDVQSFAPANLDPPSRAIR